MANLSHSKTKKLNPLIRQEIVKIFQELLSDPDFGLPLSEETEKKLKESIKAKKKGELIPFEEILENITNDKNRIGSKDKI